MPTYPYRCLGCGHEWEELAKISDPPTKVCPKCGKKKAERLIGGGIFRLKDGGVGWADKSYAAKPKSKM